MARGWSGRVRTDVDVSTSYQSPLRSLRRRAPASGASQAVGFPILRCSECGLGSAVVPEGFDPLAIYGEQYFAGGSSDGYANYQASEPVLKREFRKTVQTLIDGHPPGESPAR